MKKCRACKLPFEPVRPLQVACNYLCALTLAVQKRGKITRFELKQGREKAKTLRDWLKDAQVVFNSYIRARDRDKPCISSGRPLSGKFDAGHFRTVKAASQLRFNEDNCHGQTVHDNQHLSGNVLAYRKLLIGRIGVERVEALENNNQTHRYTIGDCKILIADYKAKLKALND